MQHVLGRSDFFFARPRPLFGVARLASLFAPFDRYNHGKTPQEADAQALANDWRVVGETLVEAAQAFEISTGTGAATRKAR